MPWRAHRVEGTEGAAPDFAALLQTLALWLAMILSTTFGARAAVTETHRARQVGDPHATERYEGLAARVRHDLPAATTLGYFTDGRAENFYKFQYAMVPVVLNPDGSGKIVLGYFPAGLTSGSARLVAEHGLTMTRAMGDGVFVLTR